MADDGNEVEGVRILGAQEAQELTRTSSSSRTSRSSRKAAARKVATVPTDESSNVDLPHWSEAPTGEVPATIVDSEGQGDGWEALTGSQPRIRVDQNDWKEVDYDPELTLMHDEISVGALGNDHISLDDNDEKFERDVAQKRGEPTAATPVISINDADDTGSQRVAKISTVPDSASTAPIVGESITSTPETRVSRVKAAASKARREKRSGAAPYAQTSGESKSEDKQSETQTLITRTATAAVLAAAAVICVVMGVIPTLVLASLLVAAMSLELCSAFRKIGSKPATLLIGVMSLFSVIAGYLVGDRAIALCAVTFFVFAALWYLFAIVKARPVVGLGISTLVYLYVGVLGSFAGMILGLTNDDGKSVGISVLVATVLCVAANDTAAYVAGKFFGRTPLAPAISPNKTMEGTTMGIVAAIVVGAFIAIPAGSVWGGLKGGIALGALVACASIFGDLVESMLKRDCGVKDFGSVLPGHGGLMDRFDGLLFALPVAFYLALTLL